MNRRHLVTIAAIGLCAANARACRLGGDFESAKAWGDEESLRWQMRAGMKSRYQKQATFSQRQKRRDYRRTRPHGWKGGAA